MQLKMPNPEHDGRWGGVPNSVDFPFTLVMRFWMKVDVRADSECWPYLGWVSKYGRFSLDRSRVDAHRVAWLLVHGDPGDDLVCHTCDNMPCCNPSHLFLGSHGDNNMDMARKGRHGIAKLKAEWIPLIKE